ncbi:MAG: signal recognition particle receptor subunit alpha, partial [Candidatus Cloacimonetes bacterium]|nr:signal recognition particle receptor subunit alpha [Candidatus Cloacimonadota bacterium]
MLSFVKSLKDKIAKTRNSFVGKIAETLALRPKIDEALMEDLEEILIQADVGAELSYDIIEELRDEIRVKNIKESIEVQNILFEIIKNKLIQDYENSTSFFDIKSDIPHIMLIVGVNGTGKTTSIGKIANQFKKRGKSVLLIAADTFRAAAVEQLTIWAQRSDIPIFRKDEGADPSSVIYDGLLRAKADKIDIVL